MDGIVGTRTVVMNPAMSSAAWRRRLALTRE
jgi:hypothetical protein